MRKQNILLGGLVVAILLIIYFIWSSFEDKKVYQIGVSQLMPHVALTDLMVGMNEELNRQGYVEGKNIFIDFKNAQGDMSANKIIATDFSKKDYDLFVGITTPTAQAIVNVIKDKPVVFTAVTDPIFAGLISSKNSPGGNVTGATDFVPYKDQLVLFKQIVPGMKKVGIVYTPSEANSQSALNSILELGPELGLEFVVVPINSTNDILTAGRSLAPKVDVIYGMPDNVVMSGIAGLVRAAQEYNKPLYSFQKDGVEMGALFSTQADYKKLGQKTAKIIVQILEGQAPGTIPVAEFTKEDVEIYLNQKTADKLGIVFPEELVKNAKEIVR